MRGNVEPCGEQPAARRSLLAVAAEAGDREAFYTHLDNQAEAAMGPTEFAAVLGELGRQCRDAGDLRAAADAYHHAHTAEKRNKAWRNQFLRMRRLAPDWGFYSCDPRRRWELPDYRGLVAPIRSLVHGWLPASAGDILVTFSLNGTVIADTRAVEPVTLPDGNRYLQFSRNLKDLMSYAGAGDTLSIEANGTPIPIVNRGEAHTFKRKASRAAELLAMLDDGFVFDKYGSVERSIQGDQNWQSSMFTIYEKLRDDVAEILGSTVFPFYGTMLGAVREQNFISYDNDFDTVYISEHTEPDAVREEFKELCRRLSARGYELKVMITHTWVRVPGSDGLIDLFFAWFNPDGTFNVSYGYHGEPVAKSAEFFAFRQEKLGTFEVPVPSNAEAILSQLYGPGWRIPDPGFAHTTSSRQVDRRYQLTVAEVTQLHWSEFYRRNEPDRTSSFAEFVACRFDQAGTLVEFGCGCGRDGIHFANRGWTTLCSDRSAEAIAKASAAAPVRFDIVDAADANEVSAFLAAHQASLTEAGPLVVYLRFFLHAVDEPTQNTLLDTLTAAISREFVLCAEFRTTADRNLAKHHGSHYRRFIDHRAFADQLRDRWGFAVEHIEAGQGLAPYDDEDPYLCRIVALRAPVHNPTHE